MTNESTEIDQALPSIEAPYRGRCRMSSRFTVYDICLPLNNWNAIRFLLGI